MLSPFAYNSCWMMWCGREARAYRRDSRRVQHAQENRLRRIVASNQATWFGEKHCFRNASSVEHFRQLVPLTAYEDYGEAIERIASGQANVLTAERVELLQPTSGTTSAEKLIPYTAGLRREFQRAIRVWIGNLYAGRPAVRRGYAYWSISPLAYNQRSTPAGVPIGFDDDASYLGNVERLLLSQTMAAPPAITQCDSLESAFYATLFFLLRCPQLALISVWSPTFLSGMFQLLHAHAEQLCYDVAQGEISRPLPPPLATRFTPQPTRADQLRAILLAPTRSPDWVRHAWPGLAVVSCWTDGPSTSFAAQLQQQLPDIEVQPKGLLSTEAMVSIPLLHHPGASLAIRSHFFEFQPVDDGGASTNGAPLLAHELEPGGQYRVVVTTSGGLYRYQTMDQVRVVGFYNQIPQLRFVGKCDRTSDLVGEKLNAAFVQSVLEETFAKLNVVPQSVELAAQCRENPYYLLRLVDARLAQDHSLCERLRTEIETALRTNPQYAYAIDAGQLGHLQIEANGADAGNPASQPSASGNSAQLHHGNFKPSTLSPPTAAS
jgi:hypothetical protein